jgi:NADH-quinone oxidoreductase subunit M
MTALPTLFAPTTPVPWLALLQLLPLLAALGLARSQDDRSARWLGAGAALGELILVLGLYLSLDPTLPGFHHEFRWQPLAPLNYHLGVDGLSLLFLLLAALLVLLIVLYAPLRELQPLSRFLALVLALEAILMSLFCTLDLLWFLLTATLEIGLVGYLLKRWATSAVADQAQARFFQFQGSGLLLLLAGILLLGWSQAQGGPWRFDLTDLMAAAPVPTAVATLAFFLLFYGLAIRTPLFPLHGWLPLVAEQGNLAVAPALLLGLKVGIYGMLRFLFPLLPATVQAWSGYVVAFAVAGVFHAALLALRQDNLRRLLAYAVVSHTSVLVIGLFSLGHAGLQGAALLSVTFGLASAGLLFMTGLVHRRTRTTQLPELGGLFDHIPLIGLAFFVSGVAIVGLPGTPGFDAVHLLLEAAIGRFGALVTIAAALGNVAAAGFLLRAFQRAFLASAPEAAPVTPASPMERVIAGLLILVLLGAGFWTEPWLRLLDTPLAALAEQFPGHD